MRQRRRVAADSNQDFSKASGWGLMRLGILVAFPLFWMAADYLFYHFIQQQYQMLDFGNMPATGYRYFWFPVVVLGIALLTGARYIQHAYDLSTVGVAFNYLSGALFTGLGGLPVITVNGGKIVLDDDDENLVYIIGGPAFVNVFPGNVVLLENLAGSVRVIGGGAHYISRLETIKETLFLEDRFAKVDKIAATSRDGIMVEARDIQYRYRLAASAGAREVVRRTTSDPYPFSEEAVKATTYNRYVTPTGVADWHVGVNNIVESVITDFIRSHRVDQLLAPAEAGDDPRGKIYEIFKSQEVVDQSRSHGVEFLWVGIGHFEAPESKVGEQHVSTWQARWMGSAERDRALGDAQRQALQDLGRADAQAVVFLDILRILEEVRGQTFATPDIKNAYLARITNQIKAMLQNLLPPPPEKPKK